MVLELFEAIVLLIYEEANFIILLMESKRAACVKAHHPKCFY